MISAFLKISSIDSVMLREDGFQVTSVDGSDKMLKHALKERWERRKERNGLFDKWNIEEVQISTGVVLILRWWWNWWRWCLVVPVI